MHGVSERGEQRPRSRDQRAGYHPGLFPKRCCLFWPGRPPLPIRVGSRNWRQARLALIELLSPF